MSEISLVAGGCWKEKAEGVDAEANGREQTNKRGQGW